ncbi:bifunctional enoyl-CoA hydratase/phosphate acetyltransferase [Altererythrobacter sp. KTW20L]|uniref:bifunctional enoyl-CoA hydratase/phosphate acetyltransferase n=1 Tax=Altererythrobacter sp. KTW20L TaxID=2942210 RepID=UPI0020C02DCC|nr:bifunctional enoyl-CoA hydratase/phosphate acetyltransferase [Altererythrobacter sp. KTW20L]MCL6250288.1 bifunctional enoyl-CoA hydratase/phosphate acetyltransferase [Altererythrobacter sp. KTW20L]
MSDPVDDILSPPRCIADILALAANRPSVRCAVVHPCDAASLGGALAAADSGLIDPVLVGPEAKIRTVADAAGLDISPFELVPVEHSHAAADEACRLARDGKVGAIMKGSLHTDELLGAVVDRDNGLRTDRRMSHVFIFEVPDYPRLLLVSDAAIIIAPDLAAKRDIVQNAIDCAIALGILMPRVAVLAAVETVHPAMVATTDAASLAKMAHRGQIVGGLVDGPLAFDNAISPAAVATKHIVSEVAGCADVLIAPDIEAGNMIAKQLTYFSEALSAGIVVGARVPIILTSRADDTPTRLASCAAALLVAAHQRLKPPR